LFLIASVSKLKEKGEEDFLKKLIASQTDDGNASDENRQIQFNPLENILKSSFKIIIEIRSLIFNNLSF
jgi:hypothetical protein